MAGHGSATQRDSVRRSIGLVFQDPTLDTYLTASQNLRFHAELCGVPNAALGPRMRQVLEMVDEAENCDRIAIIVVGKCLGGATIATFQGVIFLALAGFAHVPYNLELIAILVSELLLLSFTLTAFGVMMAARIKQFQAFMALTQMLVLPLFFLSGALYPLNGLPAWLTALTRIDPITYVVGPMRHAVFAHLTIPGFEQHLLAPPITWAGWAVPQWIALGIVAVMGASMMGVAIIEFRKTE